MRGRIWVCRRRRRSGARTAETCLVAAWTRGTRAQEARVTSGTRAPHWPWHLSPQLNILQVKSIKKRKMFTLINKKWNIWAMSVNILVTCVVTSCHPHHWAAPCPDWACSGGKYLRFQNNCDSPSLETGPSWEMIFLNMCVELSLR